VYFLAFFFNLSAFLSLRNSLVFSLVISDYLANEVNLFSENDLTASRISPSAIIFLFKGKNLSTFLLILSEPNPLIFNSSNT
jgi:hypothetical protein